MVEFDFDDCAEIHETAQKEDELSGKMKLQSFIPKGKGADKIIRTGEDKGPLFNRGDVSAAEAMDKADAEEKEYLATLGFT